MSLATEQLKAYTQFLSLQQTHDNEDFNQGDHRSVSASDIINPSSVHQLPRCLQLSRLQTHIWKEHIRDSDLH